MSGAESVDLQAVVGDLEEELIQLKQDFHGLRKQHQRRINDLESTLETKNERIAELEARLDQVEEDTELISDVRGAGANEASRRIAIILQTLKRDAEASDGMATMTATEAWNVLNREIDRTTAYDLFNRAEEIVGDEDVCKYVKEDRSSPMNSRLRVCTDAGDLPQRINGVEVAEVSAD